MAKETKPTAPKPTATSIHFAIAAIQADIRAIPKDRQNQSQGFNFRGIDDFYLALHPIFAAHGVVTVPEVLEASFDKWLNAKQNTVFCARLRVKYHFIATDGTSIQAVGYGEAFDFGDKALNKAMSMAHKYVLAQTFQIPTAEPDADAFTYEATVDVKTGQYAGKTLAVLQTMRDEMLAAKQTVPSELLGRIAELRCEAEDDQIPGVVAPTETAPPAPEKPAPAAKKNGPAKTPAAPAQPAAEKPAAPQAPAKPAAPAAAAKPQAPAAPAKPTGPAKPQAPAKPAAPAPPAEEPAPGGEPDGFGEPEGEPAAEDPLNFVLVPGTVEHKDFTGKKLGELTEEQIELVYQKWVLGHAASIAKNELKSKAAAAITKVREMWQGSKKQPA